ncbi:DUF4158 domain-containing protein [Streptosporangium sandarakinum]|uniref:DUF4158 domain-containing protein n=1 Tax=Streptosporangium sandarakinum TaxID=1260955 RepID=UPI003D9394D2
MAGVLRPPTNTRGRSASCLATADFGACEAEVRQFVAARVWASVEGPRALFDRAQVHLLKERILLPGISVLVRLVGEVRRAETERVYALLSGRLSDDMHQQGGPHDGFGDGGADRRAGGDGGSAGVAGGGVEGDRGGGAAREAGGRGGDGGGVRAGHRRRRGGRVAG